MALNKAKKDIGIISLELKERHVVGKKCHGSTLGLNFGLKKSLVLIFSQRLCFSTQDMPDHGMCDGHASNKSITIIQRGVFLRYNALLTLSHNLCITFRTTLRNKHGTLWCRI